MTVNSDLREEGTTETVRSRSRSSTQGQSTTTTMSLTYSDFLYSRNEYTEVYGDENREARRSLPSDFKPIQETKVPLMQVEDAANHDFIIIAEFSELEGPIPLCTIPNDAAGNTDIKLSDFVVHLMSTDYLVNTVGQFRICQDTQVMRKNVFPNVHVFMQYFTLYDLKARGFVRPFCFGYVSKDHIKLDKYINFLMAEFTKITSVLEHCNREWFAKELENYLQKLENAKETYIQEHIGGGSSNNSNNMDDSDSDFNGGVAMEDNDSQNEVFMESDTVTLAQIAHQYSEIKNILTIVQSFEHPNQIFNQNAIQDIGTFFSRQPDSPLAQFLKKIKVFCDKPSTDLDSRCANSASDSLNNIPLLHPLRPKGEPLRPLTLLGQLGTVYLVGRLMQIYGCCKTDIIFTEMTESTVAFRQHFENLSIHSSTEVNSSSSPGRSSGISADFDNSIGSMADMSFSEDSSDNSRLSTELLSPFELILDSKGTNYPCSNNHLWLNYSKKELYQIIEKLNVSAPIASDSKSGSYHTVSEEESDLNVPSHATGDTSVPETVARDVPDKANFKTPAEPLPSSIPNSLSFAADQWPASSTCVGGLSSFSSDEEVSITSSPSRGLHGSSEETILKEPWWVFASKKLVRGVPGYGLANFFRRYHATAHHILYSILLGRPIIICGEGKMSRKISKIITALIPLVPLPPGGPTPKSWKLLRWHQGIIVQSHIESFKLIGLCIPEKLEVHDLIPSRLVTLVTILSAEKKTILGGPAYSGDLLQNFEKNVQKNFYNSDVSLLSYIGAIYADIEAKVFTYKSLLEKQNALSRGKPGSGGTPMIFRELNLRASDVEIVKYLSTLISDPSDCVNIL